MIRLSRLNHNEIAINCDLIEWIESNPDTTVRLISGESILVRETVDEVIGRIVTYRRELLADTDLAARLTSAPRPNPAWLPARERAEDAPEGDAAGARRDGERSR